MHAFTVEKWRTIHQTSERTNEAICSHQKDKGKIGLFNVRIF